MVPSLVCLPAVALAHLGQVSISRVPSFQVVDNFGSSPLPTGKTLEVHLLFGCALAFPLSFYWTPSPNFGGVPLWKTSQFLPLALNPVFSLSSACSNLGFLSSPPSNSTFSQKCPLQHEPNRDVSPLPEPTPGVLLSLYFYSPTRATHGSLFL